MAYEALYRKARPITFDEMRGQEVVVRSLRNQILKDRISHAYLFTGIRGTGKTSAARIFARAVNCENPENGSPCNRCETCRAILDGRTDNVIEIDAAANGLVQDVRRISELCARRPMHGKYRVFIIDETQEMKTGAVNAFLKTLEEPPAWVIFILATTSLRNLPETILSRCQQYVFRRLDYGTVADQLKKVLDSSGLEAEDAALRRIAYLSEGSMRDALSLLDRAAAYAEGRCLTAADLHDALGTHSLAGYGEAVRNMADGNAGGALYAYRKILEEGTDTDTFLLEMLRYLRSVLLTKEGEEETDGPEYEDLEDIRQSASLIEYQQLIRFINIFSETQKKAQFSETKRTAAETAVISAAFGGKDRGPELEDKVSRLEKSLQING